VSRCGEEALGRHGETLTGPEATEGPPAGAPGKATEPVRSPRRLLQEPSQDGSTTARSVYIHIPFCRRRCDYCAFATFSDRSFLVDAYVKACVTAIEASRSLVLETPVETVFIGGGTPSLLDPESVRSLLSAVEPAKDAEVSLECNPDDVTEEILSGYLAAGVNRISLGVQSLRPHVLAGLGRIHDPEAVYRAVELIGKLHVPRFSVDLIYGAVAESDADWQASVEGVLGLVPRPSHVSAYGLTVEPGTPLHRDPARHPDDDVEATRYEIADSAFERAGLSWYEISNWAVPGEECRHNLNYWSSENYAGIGSAAHAHFGGVRSFNVRTPERYIAAIAEGRSPVAGREVLSAKARHLEQLELALRTSDGVASDALPVDPLIEDLVVRDAGRAVLSRKGRLLANEVLCRLVC